MPKPPKETEPDEEQKLTETEETEETEQETETETKPKTGGKTSYDKIVASLESKIKSLEDSISRKEDGYSILKQHAKDLEEMLSKMRKLTFSPEVKKGQTLLDAVCEILDWKD